MNVRNTDNWNAVNGNSMLELVRAKYDQNNDLKQLLLDTGSWRLGETGKETFFSIDLPLTHPDVLVTKRWKSNHLGNALEIARRDFRDHLYDTLLSYINGVLWSPLLSCYGLVYYVCIISFVFM